MLVPRQLAAWLEKTLPRFLISWLHGIYRSYLKRTALRMNRRLLRQLFPSGEPVVASGPFAGMKYRPWSIDGSAFIPKLLGAYEQELHGVIGQIMQREYDILIDIGCAEGYYLIGFTLKLPRITAYGFDLDDRALATCRELAKLNDVAARVHLRSGCTPENLASSLGRRTLIVCDCEGAEVELLDPDRTPGLLWADIVVELHDRVVPRASAIIQERFANSHIVTLIRTQDRDPRSYPLLSRLPMRDQRLALEEFRGPPMEWVFLAARSASSENSAVRS